MIEVTYDNKYLTTRAKVGRDTIENAKYFYGTITNRTVIELSLWDKITIPFYRIKRKLKDIYWTIRYAFQRMYKGYDYVETFDVYFTFIERYEKILIEFKKHGNSFPCEKTEEEWNNIIDEMIYHLHYMNEDNVDKELKQYVPEGWLPCWETSGKIMSKHKEEFFKLFSEYFYNLWD